MHAELSLLSGIRLLFVGPPLLAALACTTPASTSTSAPPLVPEQAQPEQAQPEQAPAPSVSRLVPFVAAVHGMAVDPQGRLYFSDSFTQLDSTAHVYTLDPPYTDPPVKTSLTSTRPAGLEHIDGSLYLCDVGADRVVQHDQALQPLRTWEVTAPWNVAMVEPGDLLATTFDGQLVRLDADGSTETLQTGLGAPFDVVVTEQGAAWISEQGAKPGVPGRVALWDPAGQILLTTDHTWATPEGLALDPQGNLWVAETEGQQLLRVSPRGEVEPMAEVDGMPVVIAPLPSGDLLVSVTGPSPHLLRVELPH